MSGIGGHIAPAPDELVEWFREFHRLVAEATERFEAGDLRPALASLAAVPPVHRLLVEGCGGLLSPEFEERDEDGPSAQIGLYL